MYRNAIISCLLDCGIHTFFMLQIIFGETFGITSMQISNRANGWNPREELNKDVQLTFSDGYTTQVNVLSQSLPAANEVTRR